MASERHNAPHWQAPIKICGLPSSWNNGESFKAIVDKYKSFRLFSLSSAPNAFAATYEQEVEFPLERWVQRLQNKDAVHFIVIKSDAAGANLELLEQGQWVGIVVLVRARGSSKQTDFNLSQRLAEGEQSQSAIPGKENSAYQNVLRFHLNALFTDPAARGRGLGGQLLQRCFTFIESEAGRTQEQNAKVDTLVDSWNTHAINLYKAHGFRKVGSAEYIVDKSKREAISMERMVEVAPNQALN